MMTGLVLLQAAGGGFMQFVPLVLIFVVMYFFMIRPQMKKAKEHKKYLENIKEGEEVVTSAGIHGKVVKVEETTFVVQVDSNTKIKFDKSAIALNPNTTTK